MLNDILINLADMNTTLQWMFVLLIAGFAMSLGALVAEVTRYVNVRLPSWRVRR